MRFTLFLAYIALFAGRGFNWYKNIRKGETFYMGGIAIIMTVSFLLWLAFNVIREMSI